MVPLGSIQTEWPGWHEVTRQEAVSNKHKIIALMDTWSIAKLAGKWKIAGPGYGSIIEPILGDEGIGEQVIARIKPLGIVN